MASRTTSRSWTDADVVRLQELSRRGRVDRAGCSGSEPQNKQRRKNCKTSRNFVGRHAGAQGGHSCAESEGCLSLAPLTIHPRKRHCHVDYISSSGARAHASDVSGRPTTSSTTPQERPPAPSRLAKTP
jgi:hypothetical protein